MGLDMYLFKSKRVPSLKVGDYEKVTHAIEDYQNLSSFKSKFQSLSEVLPEIKKVSELDETIAEHGEYFHWIDIKTKIGYWRKSNQIHSWFVKNCQGGVDECQLAEVKKAKLEKLLSVCKKTLSLKDKVLAGDEKTKSLLPTTKGFFFGSSEYDEYYFNDIEETIEILEKVLKETDFEKEIVFYQSSW